MSDITMETQTIPGAGTMQFSAAALDELGSASYTLVTIVLDVSGSVYPFATELLDCLKSVVGACKKNNEVAENLLLRVLVFNDSVVEIHGFKPLDSIDINKDYPPLKPGGQTALFDAVLSAIGATMTYSKKLMDQYFLVNGAIYIITDGWDNVSHAVPESIKDHIQSALSTENMIESCITILVGVNISEPKVKEKLESFKEDAGLTEFVDIGDATPQKLAKLGNWVSQSVSSQSQNLGSGSPSQPLAF